MKIGLGAAQFGLDYGVSNRGGQTYQQEVEKILAVAATNGVDMIDTAASYGDSEAVLGRALTSNNEFKLITKTRSFAGKAITEDDAQELEKTFRCSLEKLGRSSVYGLLVHQADDLLCRGGDMLMERMKVLQGAGLVKKIGISVYSAEQIDRLLANYDFDLIQLPVNLLDQRLIKSGHLVKLKARNVEIHARSVFLQGLVLMPPETLPLFFKPIRAHLETCRRAFDAKGISPLMAALAFASGVYELDAIICGVNDHAQLEGICAAARATTDIADFGQFALDDEVFLNPANWKLQ